MSTPRSVASGQAIAERRAFAEDVEYYFSLSPRRLPSRYLYDDLGSALFEAICRLPWYGITRAELHLLTAHAERICGHASPLAEIVELGPGNGEKLAVLLRASDTRRDLTVHLIDISAAALAAARRALDTRPGLTIVTHESEYETGLADALGARGTHGRGRVMVLCLGSNIGNLEPPDAAMFLRHIRASLSARDALLLGTDLIKPESDLVQAYDDPLGVAAAFNRNLLVRINRELGANFDLDGFAHRARWNEAERRVEMHLVSTERQAVRIPAARVHAQLGNGEPIWTESSYKYVLGDVIALLHRSGFEIAEQWIEDTFALTLAHATS